MNDARQNPVKTTFFLNSAHALFKLLDVFKTLSGLTLNSTKTEGMWIGYSRKNQTKPSGIKWPSEPIKALTKPRDEIYFQLVLQPF